MPPSASNLQLVPNVDDAENMNCVVPPRGLSDIETILRVARADTFPLSGPSSSLSRQSSRSSVSNSSVRPKRTTSFHQIPVQVVNEDARPLSSIEIAALQRRLHF